MIRHGASLRFWSCGSSSFLCRAGPGPKLSNIVLVSRRVKLVWSGCDGGPAFFYSGRAWVRVRYFYVRIRNVGRAAPPPPIRLVDCLAGSEAPMWRTQTKKGVPRGNAPTLSSYHIQSSMSIIRHRKGMDSPFYTI